MKNILLIMMILTISLGLFSCQEEPAIEELEELIENAEDSTAVADSLCSNILFDRRIVFNFTQEYDGEPFYIGDQYIPIENESVSKSYFTSNDFDGFEDGEAIFGSIENLESSYIVDSSYIKFIFTTTLDSIYSEFTYQDENGQDIVANDSIKNINQSYSFRLFANVENDPENVGVYYVDASTVCENGTCTIEAVFPLNYLYFNDYGITETIENIESIIPTLVPASNEVSEIFYSTIEPNTTRNNNRFAWTNLSNIFYSNPNYQYKTTPVYKLNDYYFYMSPTEDGLLVSPDTNAEDLNTWIEESDIFSNCMLKSYINSLNN